MKACIRPTQVCMSCWCIGYEMNWLLYHYMLFATGSGIWNFLGQGWWDMQFIDHSDNFAECNCRNVADVFSACGSFIGSNLSLCEEKQFEKEVLTGMWLWDGPIYQDMYVYNTSNPLDVSTGSNAIVQELNVFPLFDQRTQLSVDKNLLDEEGMLSWRVKTSWMVDPTRKTSPMTQLIITPHYVYATLLANKLAIPTKNNNNNFNSYPNYYPLFRSISVGALFGVSKPVDYMTKTYSNQEFSWFKMQSEKDSVYYTSERHGLQGLSFVSSMGGSEEHCGFDRDCMAGQPAQQVSLGSGSTCPARASANCNPNTLQYAAGGLKFGVSSLKALPGADYYEIDKVAPGDENVWDYTAFSAVGTTWPALNDAFFILYDVVLSGDEPFMGVPGMRWSMSGYQQRKENCGAGGGDSAGIDCSSPAGLQHVGPSFDASLPGPVYLSVEKFYANAGVEVLSKSSGLGGLNSFEMFTHKNFGMRFAYRNSHSLNIRLQTSAQFSNKEMIIPLQWSKEFFAVSRWTLMRYLSYQNQLKAQGLDTLLVCVIFLSVAMWGMICWSCNRIYKSGENMDAWQEKFFQ